MAAASSGREDSWLGMDGYIARIHGKSRSELFIPFRVACSPPGRDLFSLRLTRGTFTDGETFERIDNFRNRNEAHLASGLSWTGVTLFLLRNLDSCSGTLCDRAVKDTSAVGGSRSMRTYNTNSLSAACVSIAKLSRVKPEQCM